MSTVTEGKAGGSYSLPGILVFLSCLLLLYGIADYTLCNLLIMPGFIALEEDEAVSHAQRCKEIVERELHHLALISGDWASWNDMYKFAADRNADFIESNFVWPSLHNSKIEYVAVFNDQKDLVYSDLNRIKKLPFETALSKKNKDKLLCKNLNKSAKQNDFSSADALISGIIVTDSGPILIAIRPILTSQEQGPPRGIVIFGRFLDKSTVKELSDQINIDFKLLNKKTSTPTSNEEDLFSGASDGTPLKYSTDGTKILSYSLIQDIHGNNAVLLKAVVPRKISQIGIQTAQFTSFVLLLLLTVAICSAMSFFVWFRNKQLKQQQQIETLVEERTKSLLQKEDELEQKKRMEAIGLMAGGVAHDLNNILSGIVDHPAIVVSDLPPDSKLIAPLQAIKKSGEKAMSIVKDLLTIARGYTTEKTSNSINEIASQYLGSPEHTHLKKALKEVTFKTLFSKDIHLVKCSPSNMHQCIMNLVRNGAEAIDTVGTVKLRTYTQHIAETDEYDRKGDYTVLEVSDTGHGISKEDMDRIFDPFYSRKILGRKGTGLGLAVVWNTIQDHNGTVTVSSSPQGTVFTIHLPAADSEKAPDSCRKLTALTASGVRRLRTNVSLKTAKDTHKKLQSEEKGRTSLKDSGVHKRPVMPPSSDFQAPCRLTGGGDNMSIFVIDDEQLQRDIASSMLNRLGFKVKTFSTGEDAIAYVKKEGPPAILLIDLHLTPGLNGTETFAEIRRLYPCQKALLASGLSDHESLSTILNMGGSLFMQKPYSLKALKDALHQVKSVPLNSPDLNDETEA